MPSRLTGLLNLITKLSLAAIVLLLPLFFLPLTPEIFELPKQFLLAFLMLVALVSWVGRVVSARVLEVRRTPFDIPLLAFWAVLLMASLISRDRLTSLLGNYESFNWSFLSLTFLLIFFFLLVQTARDRRDVHRFLVIFGISGLAAEIIFIIKVFLPAAVAWLPLGNASNTVSSFASTFGLFALVQLVIAVSTLSVRGSGIRGRDVFALIVFLFSLASLVLIGFKSVWLLVAVAMFFFLVYAVSRVEELRFFWISASFALLVIGILLAFFGMPRFLTAKLPAEISLSPSVSWNITVDALTADVKGFLLGSGPGSFILDFSRFRPDSFNSNFAWNIRFSQPYSTALEVLDAGGVLGAVSFAAVILLTLGTIFFFWVRKVGLRGLRRLGAEDSGGAELGPLFWGVTSVWLTMLVAAFLTNFGTVSWFLFFAFLALLAALSGTLSGSDETSHRISLKTSPQYSLLVSFSFILIFTSVVVFGIFLGRFLTAEIAYASGSRALIAGQTERAVADIGRAVSLHPTRQTYHLGLAQAYLSHAVLTSSQGQADANLITTLMTLAVNESRRATEIAPNNVAGWQQLAGMYANARSIAPEANTWVIKSLERALELEKTNPSLYLLLGNAQVFSKQPAEATKNYQKAIQLKPDYIEAYLNLALLEEQDSKIEEAIGHTAQAALISPQNTDALFNLGRLLYNRGQDGDIDRAEAAFQAVLNINRDHANALYSLGLLAERKGNLKSALEFYRRVLELNPDNADIKKKIQSLSAPPPAASAPSNP